ncbi:2-phosphosulfolactate phosphatase, partial [bacterium]|nr:2-phosphosulfolactate phosphatase [bacterium]
MTRINSITVLERGENIPAGRFDSVYVVDILRASTTVAIAHIMGVERIYFSGGPPDALALSKKLDCPVMGEIGGRRPSGFKYGNSPVELIEKYSHEKTLIHYTTNGTSLFIEAFELKVSAFIASFINISAVLRSMEGDCLFLLAGTNGGYAYEDLYFAGMIASLFPKRALRKGAVRALRTCNRFRNNPQVLFRNTSNGINLLKIEKGYDIDFSFNLDLEFRIPRIS